MQHITLNGIYQVRSQQRVQIPKSITHKNKWLRRVYTTGFVFFLAKGVVWLAAISWAFY